MKDAEPYNVMRFDGFFARTFPIQDFSERIKTVSLNYKDIPEVSDKFKFAFENAGYMTQGNVYTISTKPVEEEPSPLGSIVQEDAPEQYYITDDKMEKWEYLKGSKRIERKSSTGHTYTFSEGAIAFPDPLDKPARTMLTSEGTTNRSTHVIRDPKKKKLRLLTPLETERIQGFNDNWTEMMPDRMRYFCMGNALVVPMITRMGKTLNKIFEQE